MVASHSTLLYMTSVCNAVSGKSCRAQDYLSTICLTLSCTQLDLRQPNRPSQDVDNIIYSLTKTGMPELTSVFQVMGKITYLVY